MAAGTGRHTSCELGHGGAPLGAAGDFDREVKRRWWPLGALRGAGGEVRL